MSFRLIAGANIDAFGGLGFTFGLFGSPICPAIFLDAQPKPKNFMYKIMLIK
jgi:hypothetical protein